VVVCGALLKPIGWGFIECFGWELGGGLEKLSLAVMWRSLGRFWLDLGMLKAEYCSV
jgi:hypothetical protein